jgi:hypothetical protein
MIRVNPNPHADGYVFIPTNRITAAFSSPAGAQSSIEALRAMGFAAANIDMFVGVEGAEALDLSGEAHGVGVRRIRNLEALLMAEDHETHQAADSTLKTGGAALAILMDGKEDEKARVAAVLRSHGAALIRYWKRWSIENLD